jgi:hypothetical protein
VAENGDNTVVATAVGIEQYPVLDLNFYCYFFSVYK